MTEDWRNNKIRQLDQQVAMMKKAYLAWQTNAINDKQFAFEMSNHFAAFSEILKNMEE